MNPVNTISFSRREFRTDEALHEAISKQIILLLDAGYTIMASVEDEKGGGVLISYSMASGPDDWPKPFWLMQNEMISAADTHIDNEVDNAKQVLDSAQQASDMVKQIMDAMGGDGGDGGNFDA